MILIHFAKEIVSLEKKILIVDDETDLLEVLVDLFNLSGWTTEVAENGLIGMQKIESFKPNVILSDINMPDMDGVEFLKQIYHTGIEIPVIFLSGFRDLDKMTKAWTYCAYDFLDKPTKDEELLSMADSALRYGVEYVKSARKRFYNYKVKNKD